MTLPRVEKVLADLWGMAGQARAALDAVSLTGAEPVLAFLVRGRHRGAGDGGRGGAGGERVVASADRPTAACQRRYAARRCRVPQRALSADRWRAAARASRQDRGPLSHRRRALDQAAHQPAASSRRNAEAARRRIRPRRRCSARSTAGRRTSWRTRRPRRASSSPRRRSFAEWDRAPAGPARWRASRCSPSSRIGDAPAAAAARGRPAARRRQGAGPDAHPGGPGRRARARGLWSGCDARQCAAPAEYRSPGRPTPAAESCTALADLRDARGTRCARQASFAEAHVFIQGYRPGGLAPVGLGSRQEAARRQSRYRLCVALGLWRRRSVGDAPRLRLARPDRHGLQS